MEMSVMLAQMIAVAFLAVGIGFIVNGDHYRKLMSNFMDNQFCIYLGGMIALIIGMLIVWNHNYWEGDWTVLVTLIGWISLLKGIKFLAFPNTLSWYKSLMEPKNFSKISWIPLVLGLIFAYFGFIA